MAVQAGLINPQIPMSAKTADVVGSYGKGFNMRGEMLQQQQQEQSMQRENQDRAIMQEALQGGADLYTPEGVDKALQDLKGKVSPDMFLKLSDHATKVKEGDTKMREGLTKLSVEELGLHTAQLDKTVTYLAQPLEVYKKSLAEKGEQQAGVEFGQARDKVLQMAAQEKGPSGQPLYPPEMLKQLAQASPEQVSAMLARTSYQKDLIDQRYKESQIQRNKALADFDEARAKAYGEGGGPGAKSEIEKITLDVKAGRLTPEQGQKMIDGIVAKKAAPSDVSTLTPEAVHNAATDHYLTGNLPARLGARERAMILNESAKIAQENGDAADATIARQAANKANKMALNDITKREALVASFERDADKRLGLILELSKKADQSGVPALNRWLNAGRTNIQGDVDVNNLNSAMISAQAELAKVLSGALGNAGVSDAARQEAAVIINKNMSPEQIESLVPNIRREMKFKLESFGEEKKRIQSEMRTPESQRKAKEGEKVASEEQKTRDLDRKAILLDEYQKTKANLSKFDPKEPATADARNRAQGDLDALKRELVGLGVKDPDSQIGDKTPKTSAAKPAGIIPAGWTVKVK